MSKYWKINKKLGRLTTKVDEGTDGAVEYEHAFGTKWQLESKSLEGKLESFLIREPDEEGFNKDPELLIGLQDANGDVNVFTCQTKFLSKAGDTWPTNEFSYIAKRVGNINPEHPVKIELFEVEDDGYTKIFPLIYQGGRKPLPAFIEKDKMPKAESIEAGGRKIWDTSKVIETLEGEVKSFSSKYSKLFDARKAERDPTEAEKLAESETKTAATTEVVPF